MATATWIIRAATAAGSGGVELSVEVNGSMLTVEVPPGSDEGVVRLLCRRACQEYLAGVARESEAATFATTLVGLTQTENL